MLGSTIMIVIFNIPAPMMQGNYYSENLIQNTPVVTRPEPPCVPSSTSDNKCEKKR